MFEPPYWKCTFFIGSSVEPTAPLFAKRAKPLLDVVNSINGVVYVLELIEG